MLASATASLGRTTGTARTGKVWRVGQSRSSWVCGDCKRCPIPAAHKGRSRNCAERFRLRCRLFASTDDQTQMVAVPAARRGHGAVRQHSFQSPRDPLVGRFFGRARSPARAIHPRNDPRLAGADARAFLSSADAAPLLPIRLPDRARASVRPLRPRTAGGDRQARLSRLQRSIYERSGTLAPPFFATPPCCAIATTSLLTVFSSPLRSCSGRAEA
jgi:hypothetical protein